MPSPVRAIVLLSAELVTKLQILVLRHTHTHTHTASSWAGQITFHKDVSLNPQNPRKARSSSISYNPSAPVAGWEAKIGESPEAGGQVQQCTTTKSLSQQDGGQELIPKAVF